MIYFIFLKKVIVSPFSRFYDRIIPPRFFLIKKNLWAFKIIDTNRNETFEKVLELIRMVIKII